MIKVIAYCRILLLIAVTCWNKTGVAQNSGGFTYEFFNSAHGLPSSEVICLAKDSKGFLWIGTSAGISKYDGYQFHNYNRSGEGEILGNVNVLVVDRDNNIWIGTDAGLFCYSGNELIKISAKTNLRQGVNDILLENDGMAWLATENGPAKVRLNKTEKVQLVNHILPQWNYTTRPLDDRRLEHIKKAADGAVYMSDLQRLFVLKENSIELLHTMLNDRDPILSLFPIDSSTIFFHTGQTEIHKIEKGMHANFQHKYLYRPGAEDLPGGEWHIGTFGLYYFHSQTATASRFINLMEHGVEWNRAMLKDNNFFWIASNVGLVKIKPTLFTQYDVDRILPEHQDYYSVLHLKNGNLLLGSNRGILVEKKDTAFTVLLRNIVPTAEAKCMYEDEAGQLWVGSGYQGLVLIKNKQVKRFTEADGLHDNSFAQFLKTSDGKLYAIGDHGLSEIIDNNGTISFKKYYYESSISKHAKFYSGIEAPDGSILIGGEEGIFCLKNDSLRPVKSIAAKSIIKDKNGMIWIATDGDGILKCSFNNKCGLDIVQQLAEKDGLNTSHYLGLLADKENNIWAASSKGLTFIDDQGHILNFDQWDGFTKPGYYSATLYQDRDGVIWVGNTFGFTSFKPGADLLSAAAPVIYINNITDSSKKSFSYNNNSFNFSFAALDYANQENIRYFYKLDGLDTSWINAGESRNVTYENLSPRQYTFRVKALNNKGRWSEQDATYSFRIRPPFWKQAWFILLSAGTAIAILILVIKNREARQAKLQKQKAAGYREQLEIEQIINHFATSMTSISNTDDLLWDVAKNCISKLKFEDCVIYLKDEDVLIQKAALGPKRSMADKIIHPVTIPIGKGITGNVALVGKAEIIGDTSLDERYIVDDERRFSEIAVPIILNEKVIGVIDSEHSQKYFYTGRHLQILTTIASLCATKINTFRAEQQAIEKEMEVLRLNKDFATSQLTALRMQMNPHFIFNALNSIQHYILQGNVVEANKYLSKFSKLQRDILHCSTQQFISLDKELEILTAYLQLEQYRFGANFTFKINMTEDIEPVEIMIPPMILQPFVENSIWHGLMPLQTERILSIYFELESDDMLVVSLRDNGIGRAASAKLKNNKEHESKGMLIVQQRLNLLQQQYGKPFEASISDITDIKGDVMGTHVQLKFFIG